MENIVIEIRCKMLDTVGSNCKKCYTKLMQWKIWVIKLIYMLFIWIRECEWK